MELLYVEDLPTSLADKYFRAISGQNIAFVADPSYATSFVFTVEDDGHVCGCIGFYKPYLYTFWIEKPCRDGGPHYKALLGGIIDHVFGMYKQVSYMRMIQYDNCRRDLAESCGLKLVETKEVAGEKHHHMQITRKDWQGAGREKQKFTRYSELREKSRKRAVEKGIKEVEARSSAPGERKMFGGGA